MSSDYSQFLKDKFLEDLEEAKRIFGTNLPLIFELSTIMEYIQVEPKFKDPSVLKRMDDSFNKLNTALAECILFAENRKNPSLKNRISLTCPNPKGYWFIVKVCCSLKSIRQTMESVMKFASKGENGEKNVYPFVYYITEKEKEAEKENMINKNVLYGIGERYHGLDEQANKIIDILQRNDKQVIGIVGMGGSGKTALARKLFFETRKTFRDVTWVNMTEFTDPNTDRIRKENGAISPSKLFFDSLREELEKNRPTWISSLVSRITVPENKRKKSMVILDGVWHESCTEGLIRSILGGGDVIIVTSRFEWVVKSIFKDRVENVYLHRMEPIGSDDCWRIFEETIRRKEMFDGGVMSLEKNGYFSKMKDEIVEKCDGLPFAAKAIAEAISYRLGEKGFWTNRYVRKTIKLRVTADAPVLKYLQSKHRDGKISWDEKTINQNSGVISVNTNLDPREFMKHLGPFYPAELISVVSK